MNQNHYLDDAPQQMPGDSRHSDTNTLAIIGFIFCFCLPPLGLLLSLIALRRPPRGLAIAGAILGGVGTLGCTCLGIGAWFAWPMMRITESVRLESLLVTSAAEGHARDHDGALPDDLSVLNLGADVITDAWGNPYVMQQDASGLMFVCVGPDGALGTSDDLRLPAGLTEMQRAQLTANWMATWPPDAVERAKQPAP